MFSLSLLVSVCSISCKDRDGKGPITLSVSSTKNDMIKRGEYLVTIMGCDDCHTPKKLGPQGPEPDMDNRFSGHPSGMPLGTISTESLKSWVLFNPNLTAFVGPWGVSYAANLTSDEAGIGGWTEQQFIKALREGKYKGLDNTRPLLPPMPWQNFGKATDDDLKAIFSYLKTTKPIKNVVPSAVAPDNIAFLK